MKKGSMGVLCTTKLTPISRDFLSYSSFSLRILNLSASSASFLSLSSYFSR